MQDGQNCICPSTSFSGVDWGLDEAMQELLLEHEEQHWELKSQPLKQDTVSSSSSSSSTSGSTGSAFAPHDHQTSCLAQGGTGFREFISVLVWNTPQRLQEYMPAGSLMPWQRCVSPLASRVLLASVSSKPMTASFALMSHCSRH
jgi:hypothetical protein